MPEWLSWLHLPDISNRQFEIQKEKYVQDNGYTITIPGLSDIIKIQTVKPMTDEEHAAWSRKDWDFFAPTRLQDLQREKAKRRARYESMLASPQPQVIRAAGSIMTAIDDAQDGISTLAVMGQIAKRVAPKALEKLLSGPVGVLTTVADILNLIQTIPQQCMAPLTGKRTKEQMTDHSSKHKKAKAKYAGKLNKALVGKGDVIQALQTTEQVFGFGLSLGPIMGLLVDTTIGAVRMLGGQPVTLKLPKPDWQHWWKVAGKVFNAVFVPYQFQHRTDDDEIAMLTASALLSLQHINEMFKVWNPLDQVQNIEEIECRAPSPWHTQTLEVIQEAGHRVSEKVAWPCTGQLWSTYRQLSDISLPIIQSNLSNLVDRNKHSWRGYLASATIAEGGMFTLSVFAGEDNVEYQYSVSSRVASMFLAQQTRLDPNQPAENFTRFVNYLRYLETADHYPTFQEIIKFCKDTNIKLA